MKKNENYPKYVQAMRMMDEGKSAYCVSRLLKIGYDTLVVLRPKYLAGGELSMMAPPHKTQLSCDKKIEIIKEIENKGISLYKASMLHGIPHRTIARWIMAYKRCGTAGLVRKNKAKRIMKKKRRITDAELEELKMLRERNEYLEAENALLKKVKALVEERESRLRAIGRGPSKN